MVGQKEYLLRVVRVELGGGGLGFLQGPIVYSLDPSEEEPIWSTIVEVET